MYEQDLADFKAHYRERIPAMFSAVSDLYAEYWHDFFHFALFERDDEPWEAAFARTHGLYFDYLKVAQAERVLEMGCGRGGFSNLLADQTPGSVLGIDLSPAQLAHARRYERANLRFQQHDIMEVDTLGETFDAVVCLDAACYLPDKRLAVEKVGRLLRPGGRFLLVDWCKPDDLGSIPEELVLHPFMRYWAVPSLETPEGYRRHFQRAGLDVLRVDDLNAQARPNWNFGYERALDGVKELSERSMLDLIWTGMKLGQEGVRLIKEQFHAALYIKAGFDGGFLRYTLVLGEKPAGPGREPGRPPSLAGYRLG
ncbi:MAG TPA: methyltransferase domain-containing protein [Rubricoccaceae bacterium]|nr:methyltransferase domain-containing protein [Rubricoccaceae bacterium]